MAKPTEKTLEKHTETEIINSQTWKFSIPSRPGKTYILQFFERTSDYPYQKVRIFEKKKKALENLLVEYVDNGYVTKGWDLEDSQYGDQLLLVTIVNMVTSDIKRTMGYNNSHFL